MSITPEILERTVRFEGSIPHMYLNVTCVMVGVSHPSFRTASIR